jgi:hypothetical protein
MGGIPLPFNGRINQNEHIKNRGNYRQQVESKNSTKDDIMLTVRNISCS